MAEFMTVTECAAYLGKHPMTIYRWIDAGTIKVSRIGRMWIIDKADIDKMLKGKSNV